MIRSILDETEKINFYEVENVDPNDNEVRIKINRVGICGSDIHAFHGQHPTMSAPVTMGHELAGVIDKVGTNVDKFKVGDRVTVRPQVTCGKCYYCEHGYENVCSNLAVIGCRKDYPGGGQEYMTVDQHLVFKLADNMTMEDGAMVEPVTVAIAAVNTFKMNVRNKNILVLGGGTIGNLVAQCAKAKGARSVTITDIFDEKLEIARSCGIDHTINTMKEDLKEKVKEYYGEYGLDGILECVGTETTLNQAIQVSRKEGEIIIVGIYAKDPHIHMIDVQEHELHISGVLMYSEAEFEEAIQLISNRKINIDELKSAHFPLAKYNEAFQYIIDHKKTSMKVFVDVPE